ncbi:MAG: DUF4384 domain-containing protein [Pseudomonadota bacterium]|nr:DUF4384 domain-containing protein [Pseudomonadota bacterium]
MDRRLRTRRGRVLRDHPITGKTPPTSVGRLMNDNYVPMRQAGAGRYSPEYLAAIDRALIVKPEQRTQSIDDLRHDLGMVASAPDPAKSKRRSGASTMAGTLTSGVGARPRSRVPLMAALGVVALLVIGGSLYVWLGSKASAPPKVATGTPAATPNPAVAAPIDVTSAAAPAAVPERAVPIAAPVAGPFDPVRELERVATAQSPDYKVEAAADKPQLKINKDKLTFKVKTEKEGHLYVLMHGTDGGIIQLFPNGEAKNNLIRADSTLSLPSGKGNWDIGVGGPAGTDYFVAIVSKYPRDFSSLGLKVRDGFAQTTSDAAGELARTQSGGASILAGRPICTPPCTDDYGAALLTAEEVNRHDAGSRAARTCDGAMMTKTGPLISARST